jgi:hypothetical protein
MPIAILVLALVAYGYVMVAYPEYRTIGLAVGGAAAVGLGAYFWLTEPESARAGARIEPAELTLGNLALEPTPRGARLSGRVQNGSTEWRLREMTIELTLHDCPDDETPLAECAVVGDSSTLARPDAPPGQTRAFSAQYTFANIPEPAGVLRYEWTVTETRATQ